MSQTGDPKGTELPVASLMDVAWRQIAAIDAALAAGEIDESDWHEATAELVRPSYLAAGTPWEQSGKSGSEADWVASRRFVVDALDRSGTFLDCGCANGYLMECVAVWAAPKGLEIEPYGVDIVAEFVDLARRRLPRWAERFWVGNILTWLPPCRFDAVRVGFEYVPSHRKRELVAHLFHDVVAPGGRLIIGPFTQQVDSRRTEADLVAWGYPIGGRSEVAHVDARVVKRLVWIDAPST
jgi:SAM-dependent methyltransferase